MGGGYLLIFVEDISVESIVLALIVFSVPADGSDSDSD